MKRHVYTPKELAIYVNRLKDRGIVPGQHFKSIELHKVVWPHHPAGAWIVLHREQLAWIADQMEDSDLIHPSFGPRGGEGWALTH